MNISNSSSFTTYVAYLLVSLFVLGGAVVPFTSHALSCVAPSDLIPEQLASSSNSLAFTGTVTELREAASQTTIVTVAVDTAHKGAVPSVVDIAYQYSNDWGYGCSSDPSEVGERETFLTWLDDDGNLRAGLSFSEDSALYEVFSAELATQSPSSSIYTVATSSQENTQSDTAFSKLLTKLQAMLEQLKVMLGFQGLSLGHHKLHFTWFSATIAELLPR